MSLSSGGRDLLRITHWRAPLSRAVGRDAGRCGPKAGAADDEDRGPDIKRPGSRTGPWAPTSLTRPRKEERRLTGQRGGEVW
jgi:hypothetical protein